MPKRPKIDVLHQALRGHSYPIGQLVLFVLVAISAGCAAPVVKNPQGQADFASRCADPNVIRCSGFETEEMATHGGSITWSAYAAPAGTFVNGMIDGTDLSGRVQLSVDQKASGNSSLKFFMPSQTGAGFAGQFYTNFSDDYSIQFGEGEEFYIRWRQRFSKEFLNTCLSG